MPFKYSWVVVLPECNWEQVEDFLDAQKSYKAVKTQDERCQLCFNRRDPHTMKYRTYKCNSTLCGDACEWFLKVLCCDEREDRPANCIIYQHCEHVTEARSPRRPGLNLQMKRAIREWMVDRPKPNAVLNRLIGRFNLRAPDVNGLLAKVQNFCTYYRTAHLNETAWVDDMEALIQLHKFRDGLDDTKAFVFCFTTDESGNPRLGSGSEDEPVVVGFTTKVMLGRLEYAATHVLHMDATFKTNTCKFPIIVVGVSDTGRHFHPVAFFITSSCKTELYRTALASLVQLYERVFEKKPRMTYIMADAEDAERNAFETIVRDELSLFQEPQYLMCFYHVMANARKYAVGLSEDKKRVLYRHIYRIHYSRTMIDYVERVQDALNCWDATPGCEAFRSKFANQWLEGRYTKWHCAAAPPGFARTNNPCEQFNRDFKRDYTKGFALPLNTLFMELLRAAHDKSVRMRPFALHPEPAADQVARYRALLAEDSFEISPIYRNSISFMIGGDTEKPTMFHVIQRGVRPTEKPQQKFLDVEYDSDDAEEEIEIVDMPRLGWIVDVEAGTCTCRTWRKHAYCVHLIACRAYLRLDVPGLTPPRVKFVIRGQVKKKHQPGRAAKVGPALSLQ